MMRIMKPTLVAALLAKTALASVITVSNNCPFTVWPSVSIDARNGVNWEARAGTSFSVSIADNWRAVLIWGCSGDLVCGNGTSVPTTLAEFTFSGSGGQDYYDVSFVDGYNLPVKITPSVSSCGTAGCSVDLGPNCPAGLKGPSDSTGFPVGCKSDCMVDPNPSNSPSCCTGQYSTAATCPPSGVPHYSYFKDNCPDSYVYAFDEGSGTALWTCSASKYIVTFCP